MLRAPRRIALPQETPEDFTANPARQRQKNYDARWTKKHERSDYGYKNHISVDEQIESQLRDRLTRS